MKFLDQSSAFLFFTGKGGVGKTSIACATAVQLAEGGKRVLLVSTDPASNVDQYSACASAITSPLFPAVARLSTLENDPEAAAQTYRDRIVGSVRGICLKRWSRASRNNFPVLALRRLPPSMNSRPG